MQPGGTGQSCVSDCTTRYRHRCSTSYPFVLWNGNRRYWTKLTGTVLYVHDRCQLRGQRSKLRIVVFCCDVIDSTTIDLRWKTGLSKSHSARDPPGQPFRRMQQFLCYPQNAHYASGNVQRTNAFGSVIYGIQTEYSNINLQRGDSAVGRRFTNKRIQREAPRTVPSKLSTSIALPSLPPRNCQSHRPSFQPVRHLCSQSLQLKTGFPSFLFTSLCASQSHHPKSRLLSTFGASFLIYAWKSSAQVQHGYSFAKRRTKASRSDCCDRVGSLG